MSEPFVGEIRMFAGNFSPRNWAYCDGQLLQISQNDALFSLLGTIYGGDGRTTFGLPDLRGRIPIHQGNGYALGRQGGQEVVTLNVSQMPTHTHPLTASSDNVTSADPDGKVLGAPSHIDLYRPAATINADLNAAAVGNSGGSQGHSNIQPFLCIHFIIALLGIYPSRN